MAIAIIGAYVSDRSILDIAVALAFGFIGFGMIRYGFPRSCFIIAFVLGSIAEENFRGAWARGYGTPIEFFTRPASIVLMLCILALILIGPVRKLLKTRKARQA